MPSTDPGRGQRYGGKYQRERKAWAPLVAQGGVVCRRCHRLILPGQAWDLGHDDGDPYAPTHPEHRHRTPYCLGNRPAGAIKGNRLRGARRAARSPRQVARRARTLMVRDDW